MNKKLLTIAIALVILAMVVAPVAAQLPAKSPLPSGKPFENIWTFLQDLQNQISEPTGILSKLAALTTRLTAVEGTDTTQNSKIAALEAKVAALEAAKPYIGEGMAWSGVKIPVPAGYSIDQCKILVSPRWVGTVDGAIYFNGFNSIIFSEDSEGWVANSELEGVWGPKEVIPPDMEPNTDVSFNNLVNYLLICQK